MTPRDKVEAELLTYALKLYEDREKVPITSRDEATQLTLRQQWEGNLPLTIAERVIIGTEPE